GSAPPKRHIHVIVEPPVPTATSGREQELLDQLACCEHSSISLFMITAKLQKINDLDRNISLVGYEVRDIKNGVGGRDCNSGSRRSGSPQDYTGDVQTLWQDFKDKRRLERRTGSSMYSKISEEIRELRERLGDAIIRKFHKRLTSNLT
ncbi:4178_t:CDS:2, partial [Paraglomus brasilianum]